MDLTPMHKRVIALDVRMDCFVVIMGNCVYAP